MSNKLPKDEVILKSTKVFQKKNDNSTAVYFRNEFDGALIDCILALASMVVDLENQLPEEDKARFRSDFMEYLNKIRCGQVIN